MFTEYPTSQGQGICDGASVPNTNSVPTGTTITVKPTLNLQTIQQPTSACIPQQRAPTSPEIPPDGMSALQKSFRHYSVSKAVTEIFMASWRLGTKKQYKSYIKMVGNFTH